MKQVYPSDVSLNVLGVLQSTFIYILERVSCMETWYHWWLVSLLEHYGQLQKSYLQGMPKPHDMVSAMVASIPHVCLGLGLALNTHTSVRHISHILKEGLALNTQGTWYITLLTETS